MASLWRRGVLTALLSAALPSAAAAQDVPLDSAPAVTWRTAVKFAGLFSRAPYAPELFTERNGAQSLLLARTEPAVTVGTRTVVSMAYEQRVRSGTDVRLATSGVLPSSADAPFRVRQLDWTIAQSSDSAWEHEIDRLNARVQLPRAELTIGRQAIGWGRGVMFGAVDLFAPFSPLEADREWRGGVDALRADVRLTDRSSLDLVAAFGDTWDASAVGARLRGYSGEVDVEVMAGRRARDLFAGVTSSAAVGDAELHGELALFAIPRYLVPNEKDLVWKAVAGGSYRFPIGTGVLAYAEYHYSGFGAPSPEAILPLLATPQFAERYLRGDMQTLSRHAVAVTGSYEQSVDIVWSGRWVLNPADGSGVVVPGFTFTLRDDVSIVGNGYLAYGAAPSGLLLRSEYGTAPLAVFLQLRLYF